MLTHCPAAAYDIDKTLIPFIEQEEMRMKKLIWSAALGALAACATSANPGGPVVGTAADSTAIRAIAADYAQAFTKHDATLISPVIADDYQDVDVTGKVTQGHDAAVAAMKAGMPPDSGTMTAATTYIRFLTPTSAIAGGTWTMTTANGPPARGAWMAAAVKKDSTWKTISTLAANDDSALMAMAASMPKPGKKKGM
jgi:uncharacterized protein (TIGR02246 family)